MTARFPDVLTVDNLTVTYPSGARAVRGVSFAVQPGECLALVGESGCGKTSIARAIAGLLPRHAKTTGSVLFNSENLLDASADRLRDLRGASIGYVPQDPFAACNPLHTVAQHLAEPWISHQKEVPWEQLQEHLASFGIPDAARRLQQMPHEWSGGMLQRAVIAAALAHNPPLLIADEPTSALDTELADRTLDLLRATGAAVVVVSHDLDLVAKHADRIAVCYAGQVVEIGDAAQVSAHPRHPYTAALGNSLPRKPRLLPTPLPGSPPKLDGTIRGCAFAPRCVEASEICSTQEPVIAYGAACHKSATQHGRTDQQNRRRPLPANAPVMLEARGVSRSYGVFTAVAPTDISVRAGEIVGICGPSGSGKSTLLRLLGQMEPVSAGLVSLTNNKSTSSPVMPIFQDPTRSLNPRWPIWRSVVEPITRGRWIFNRTELREQAHQILQSVGLGHLDIDARPAELSVGQCQRVAIARALAAEPSLLIADEPTSALDAAASARVMQLMDQVVQRGTAIVMVSHNRKMLESLCDRVLTMERGHLSEDAQATVMQAG